MIVLNINLKYSIDLMNEILNIPSPGGDTSACMERLKDEFHDLGIEVSETNKGAIFGTIRGEKELNQRLISAHVDTLGAMVKEIKPNGRLRLSNIGGFSWNSVEGENVYIKTESGKVYTGTVLPEKASVHIYSDAVTTTERNEETIEVRVDEDIKESKDTKKLGIAVGDFVSFEPRNKITESGYIKSRHLDDKACIAVLFASCKHLKDNNLIPKYTTHFFISNYEEIGHGLSGIPKKTNEILALDIGTVGGKHTSDEKKVTIVAKDSRTPYDLKFRNRLVDLAQKNDIDYEVDVHYRYGSDASLSVLQGVDANFACIGMGVDATHHYERTHKKGIKNNIELLISYLMEN